MKWHAVFFAMVVAVAVALAGCHTASSTNTQTFPGTFEAASVRLLQVRMAEPGQLSSNKVIPMDPKVRIMIAGKASTVNKLVIGQSIEVTQNLDTHRVVLIEAK